jgi:hypothetical protein
VWCWARREYRNDRCGAGQEENTEMTGVVLGKKRIQKPVFVFDDT